MLKALSPLTVSAKTNIILAALGIKPAGWIDLRFDNDCESYTRESWLHDAEALRIALTELSLPFRQSEPHEDKDYDCWYITFSYGRELERFHDIVEREHTRQRCLDLGLILGYPASAVMYFTNNKPLRSPKLPEAVRNDPLRRFVGFWLSPDNWQMELAIVELWKNAVIQVAPWLWDEALADSNGRPKRK